MVKPSENAERASKCVFVVEDESLVAMGLESMLRRLGHDRVHLFTNAEDALARLDELRPDVILMDIKLGEGLDGLGAAREVMLRRPCPVIITTAFAEDRYLEEAMQSHVFGYLVKPITSRQLAGAMAVAEGRFGQFQTLQDENVSLREALETRKVVERAKGILMHRRAMSETAAYELMRTQSQQQSRPMREIAQKIIDAREFI